MTIILLEFARTGLVFGILGIVTGAIWANYQWGKPWSGDPKQNGAAIALLIYMAYFVLRGSMNDLDKRSRISAVYNIFAFAMLFPTIWILPRLTESLHPGGQGSEEILRLTQTTRRQKWKWFSFRRLSAGYCCRCGSRL